MTEFTDDMKYIIDLEEENKNLNEENDTLLLEAKLWRDDYKELKAYAEKLESDNDTLVTEIEELRKKNKSLKDKLKYCELAVKIWLIE